MYKKIVEAKYPLTVYLKFAVLLSLAYLPLWSFRMSLKNDALTLSYPLFQYFSEQLRSGHLPWWHYNLHMGFPLHADPGFPFWSPVTWFWALLGSNLYAYTLLVYFYIIVGGIGMLKLLRWFRFSETTQVLLAVGFCISGFFSSHLQHPHYVFEAAFVPFALLYFLRLAHDPVIQNAALFAVSIFFLVNSGYPSFTISAVYFFGIFLICIALFNRNISARAFLYLALSILLSVVLSLPFLYSLYEFLPFFNRSVPDIQDYLSSGGMSLRSFLSLLFPLASVSDPVFFGTDRAWSNIYIGLLPTILLIPGFRHSKHPLKWPIAISGCFMLILSTQGITKELLGNILPMFHFLRSNGGLRIYYMVIALIVAGWGLDHYTAKRDSREIKKIMFFGAGAFFVALVLALLFLPAFPLTGNLREFLKNLSIRNALIIQSVFSIGAIILMLILIKNKRAVLAIGLAEMTIAFVINLPFTGLGMNTTHQMQQRLASKITDYSTYPSGLVGYYSLEKSPQFSQVASSGPVTGTAYNNFQISGDGFSFNGIAENNTDTIVIAQNYYPNWKILLNNQPIRATVMHGTLMGIAVSKGEFSITGAYKPLGAIICFALSIFGWISVVLIYVYRHNRKHSKNYEDKRGGIE